MMDDVKSVLYGLVWPRARQCQACAARRTMPYSYQALHESVAMSSVEDRLCALR